MAFIMHKFKMLDFKKALATISLAGIAAMLLSSPLSIAAGPQFNIFPITYTPALNKDLPLLDGRNATDGEGWSTSQSDHDAGVNADPGDVVEFSVYYHNGMPNADENTAINTLIRAFATPSLGSTATTHRISASISAQNASTVSSSDSSRGGDVNIQVQGGQAQSISLVPGSVVLFKDQGSNPQTVNLPDTIFTSGVNIGNIRGCFEFHGFVNFKVKVSQIVQGDLGIQKNVKNVTKGTGFNATEVSADPGDTVEYQILVSAQSNSVPSVFVKDALDPKLTLNGAVTVDGVSVSSSSFFSSSGVNIGTVNTDSNRDIRFRATVASASQFSNGTFILPNTATAFTTNKSTSDGADVRVVITPQIIACTYTWDAPLISDGSGRGSRRVNDRFNVQQRVTGLGANQNFNRVFQHVSGAPVIKFAATANSSGVYDQKDTSFISSSFTTGDYNAFIELNNSNVAVCTGMRIEPPVVSQINLDKTVRNETIGGSFVDQADAQPSERVTFKLVVDPQNSNSTLTSVVVRDTLPNKVSFVSGTLNVNGVQTSEGAFFSSGLSVSNVSPGSQLTITFQADVAGTSQFTAGTCEILTNSATVTAATNLSDSDTALVKVCKQAPVKEPGTPSNRPF